MSTRIDRHNWVDDYGDLLWSQPLNPEAWQSPFPRFTPPQDRDFPWPEIETHAYKALAYNREDNDCGVRALAVACNIPYEKALWSLQEAGRIAGQSCCMPQIIDAAHRLRHAMVATDCKSKTIRTVERELANTHGGFIVTTLNHAVGVWNGELIDHARGRLWRLDGVYRIEPMRSEAP